MGDSKSEHVFNFIHTTPRGSYLIYINNTLLEGISSYEQISVFKVGFK